MEEMLQEALQGIVRLAAEAKRPDLELMAQRVADRHYAGSRMLVTGVRRELVDFHPHGLLELAIDLEEMAGVMREAARVLKELEIGCS